VVDINNGRVGDDNQNLLVKVLTVKKNISAECSLFCCFWIEMLHRRVEIEKQHFKKEGLRKAVLVPTTVGCPGAVSGLAV